MPPSRRPALLVVAAGVFAAMHVGKLPTAIPVLRESLGVTLVEAGFLLSLVQLAGMLLGAIAGLAADSLGLRRTMLAGLTLLSLASIAGGWAHSAGMLMFLRGVEGLGFLLASMPAPSLIRKLVPPEGVSAALGWWGAFMPLGTAAALLLGPLAIDAMGWGAWWQLLGVCSAAMALVVLFRVPADLRTAAGTRGQAWPTRLARTLRASGPWLVAASFAVYSSQWLAVIGFLPTVYQQAGLTARAAGAATALAAVVNMVGNIASGRMLQRGFAPEHLLRVGFLFMALGGVLAFAPLGLAGAADPAVRYAAALAFSMFGGLVPGTLFSLAVRVAPAEDTVSTTVGWMQQWSSAGQFAGPPLVAWIAGVAGGWQWSGAVTASWAMAGLALTFPLGRARRRG